MTMTFREVRRLFPVTDRYVYLNHAAISPLSTAVTRAIKRQLDEQAASGVEAEYLWEERLEEARSLAAGLINATPSEIAFVTNTSHGLNLFARGIEWRRGDNVVLPRVEFPANVYPWLALSEWGVELRFVDEVEGRIRTADIAGAIDSRTRVAALSFVEYASGFRNDLAAVGRLCRERDIHLVVDAIQGLGALRLDVGECGVSALAAGGHKWLMAPQGTGIFYCPADLVQELRHPMPGWKSVCDWDDYHCFRYDLFGDSRRYESAQMNFMGITGLLEALRIIHGLGPEAVEARVLELTDHLCRLLTNRGYRVFSPREGEERSGIVSFYPGRSDPDRLRSRLLERGIVVAARAGRIRVSPHFYNTREEIENLVDALD
jgi:selenocysteine lyase/cysteine desulfurase